MISLPSNSLGNWKLVLFKPAWLTFWFFSVAFLDGSSESVALYAKESSDAD